jgi:hypothetical protein
MRHVALAMVFLGMLVSPFTTVKAQGSYCDGADAEHVSTGTPEPRFSIESLLSAQLDSDKCVWVQRFSGGPNAVGKKHQHTEPAQYGYT